ncbi:hypothetical protein [Streptomyces sp. NBC_01304]|uniref:hypothetical protein n=1 Tax=Streptomyces sp. NBC_01304 TaxID=2903818 RepID=UPI002E11B5FF|nr:hypothetical protein OG430_21205 [Streptomyces sp. NBC_01304]
MIDMAEGSFESASVTGLRFAVSAFAVLVGRLRFRGFIMAHLWRHGEPSWRHSHREEGGEASSSQKVAGQSQLTRDARLANFLEIKEAYVAPTRVVRSAS